MNTSSSEINWMIKRAEPTKTGAVHFSGRIPYPMLTKVIAWFKANNAHYADGSRQASRSLHHNGLRLTFKSGTLRGNERDVRFWAEPLTPEEIEADQPDTALEWLYAKVAADRKWRALRDGDQLAYVLDQDYIDTAWLRWANRPRPGDKDYIPF